MLNLMMILLHTILNNQKHIQIDQWTQFKILKLSIIFNSKELSRLIRYNRQTQEGFVNREKIEIIEIFKS